MLTPLEKLKSLPGAASFLKEGAGFDALDRAAAAQTDMQAAKSLNRARDELFRKSTAPFRPRRDQPELHVLSPRRRPSERLGDHEAASSGLTTICRYACVPPRDIAAGCRANKQSPAYDLSHIPLGIGPLWDH